jgi:uridine kinase
MAPQSFLIGVAGPSGAGKSLLARHLAEKLQSPVLSLDHYYRDLSHLSIDERDRFNFDEPGALEHELLIEHVADLQQGRTITIPTYNFSIHTRTRQPEAFQPAAFVIVEGLFTLHWEELRRLLETSVYVEMADDICLQRRTERDVQERGRTPESVVAQFRTTVAPMAERYVKPTLRHADVVIPGSMSIHEGVARVLEHVGRQARNHNMKRVLDYLSSLESTSAH